MRFIKTKKGLAFVAGLIAVAVAAVGAYAYFTTTGSGTGSTTAGVNTQTITLHATIAGAIVPGDGGQNVTFTGDNPNTTTSLRVRTISFASVTSTGACQTYLTANPTDFSMADVTSDTTIPASQNLYPLSGTGVLMWANNDSVDQTPCAGAPLTLHVTSN